MEGAPIEPREPLEPLKLLLAVQDEDLELDRLAYRRREAPERHRLAELTSNLAGLVERSAAAGVERAELAKRQDEVEAHVQALVSRIGAIDARLRSTSAGSFRDQQAMSTERQHLDERRRGLEDGELEIWELLEPVDSELARLSSAVEAAEAEVAIARSALVKAESELDGETSGAAARRAELATGLPTDLAAIYERLRAKLGGVGAAKVVGGACSGCHLTLPSRERDQVLHAPAGTVFYCEQCGRILVP